MALKEEFEYTGTSTTRWHSYKRAVAKLPGGDTLIYLSAGL